MTIAELMIPELEAEAAMTRSVLALIPDDKLNWTPGEGPNTVGWNAAHLAAVAGWVPVIVGESGLDIDPADPAPPPPTATAAILKEFDANLAASLAALRGVPDAVMAEPWTMTYGGQTLFTMAKGPCLRKWIFTHTAHHRGILSAYLRLAGVPHTSIYES